MDVPTDDNLNGAFAMRLGYLADFRIFRKEALPSVLPPKENHDSLTGPLALIFSCQAWRWANGWHSSCIIAGLISAVAGIASLHTAIIQAHTELTLAVKNAKIAITKGDNGDGTVPTRATLGF